MIYIWNKWRPHTPVVATGFKRLSILFLKKEQNKYTFSAWDCEVSPLTVHWAYQDKIRDKGYILKGHFVELKLRFQL